MLSKVIVLACLAISSATAEPQLEHPALAYAAGAHHHLLGGAYSPDLYGVARSLSPLQYASSLPVAYAAQLLNQDPFHRTRTFESAPLHYSGQSYPPLLYSTPPHFHHPSWEDTLAPPPVTPIIHQPSSPHPVEHHHFYHPQPVATPLLHTPQPLAPSSTIPVVHPLPLLTSKPWTPPEVWDPVPAAAILPSSSTPALAEVHYHIPAKWRRVLRARKLLTGWPLNFLHLSRRRGPWAKHARRLGRIVSRIRWLEKYIWRSHTTVKHYH
ncbi:amelogenin, X isoform-like isoform X2 [Culex pipiens pallens]|uniref:amelogenin, X isoform-like isoform X2 n=1 Tax=Culex pipiens pallens TaxID=42434 RepID=UPI0022AA68CC|nr:amelogenin, X isoform-like isoform X2 [Culex pipiens pallens]